MHAVTVAVVAAVSRGDAARGWGTNRTRVDARPKKSWRDLEWRDDRS